MASVSPLFKTRLIRNVALDLGLGRAHSEMRNTYKILVEKPEGKRPVGRPRCGCEDIKMDLWKIGLGMWIGVIWLRVGIGGGHL
jgi:hypothetical protein